MSLGSVWGAVVSVAFVAGVSPDGHPTGKWLCQSVYPHQDSKKHAVQSVVIQPVGKCQTLTNINI